MKEYICPRCHAIGKAHMKKRGSTAAEVTSWLVFPIGLPYAIWRALSKFPVCRFCEETALMDLSKPAGQDLLLHLSQEENKHLGHDAP